jgi:hypothetical protein
MEWSELWSLSYCMFVSISDCKRTNLPCLPRLLLSIGKKKKLGRIPDHLRLRPVPRHGRHEPDDHLSAQTVVRCWRGWSGCGCRDAGVGGFELLAALDEVRLVYEGGEAPRVVVLHILREALLSLRLLGRVAVYRDAEDDGGRGGGVELRLRWLG